MSKNQLLWPAYRGGRVEQILGEQKVRDSIQIHLNELAAANKLQGLTADEIKADIVHYIQNDLALKWVLTKRAAATFGWKFMYYFKLATKLLLIVLLLPILLIFFIPVWCFWLQEYLKKEMIKTGSN